MVPLELKNLNDAESSKSEIRKWETNSVRMYIMSAIYAQYRLCEYQ